MKKIALLLQMVVWIAIAATAQSQSLADLAKKENDRRQQIKNDKVITDEQADKYRTEPLKTNAPEPAPAKPDSDKKDAENPVAKKSENPDSDEPMDFEGRPESYWRKTMAESRQKVKDLENQANALTLKIADLQTQFYREDNGFKREDIQREIQKSFYEQDKNKEDLVKAKDILQDLEKEARKSGALPGWLR
jgi:hypothetical protein